MEVSLTPLQASASPSILGAVTPILYKASSTRDAGQEDENPCERRLKHLMEFVERNRFTESEISNEFRDQLGRVEHQLAELGRIIRERMEISRMAVGGDNLQKVRKWARSLSPGALSLHHQTAAAPPSGVIISLSPPPSASYGEVTATSAEIPATIETSSDVSILPNATPASVLPRNAENDLSSLHAQRSPEIPETAHGHVSSTMEATPRIPSNSDLRGIIERLSESLDALVTKQKAFNDTLEGLRHRGVVLEPVSSSFRAENEDPIPGVSKRRASVLRRLERFAELADIGLDRRSDDTLSFLDLASSRESPPRAEDVQIRRAFPMPTGAVSMAYAHKLQVSRGRSRSFVTAANSRTGTLSLEESSVHSRARSVDAITTMGDEPSLEGPAKRSPVMSLGSDAVRDLQVFSDRKC